MPPTDDVTLPGPQKLSEEQLRGCFDATAPYIRSYLRAHLPVKLSTTISIDDLMQEIQIVAWQRAVYFRPTGPNSFRNWLMAIARNKLINEIKHAQAVRHGGSARHRSIQDGARASFVRLLDDLAASTRSPSSCVRSYETIDAVRNAVMELDDDQREAVRLRYIEDLSNSTVAGRLSKSESAVESILFRAKQNLRKRLQKINRL